MTEEIYFRGVHNVTEFTRNELFVSFRQGGYQLSEASFYKKVEDMVNDSEIVRVGRNHYCLPNDKRQVYRHDYSELAEEVALQLEEQYPYLNFTIFEFVQMNDFVNHLVAHNVIFLSVESDTMEFVFDTLKEKYPGMTWKQCSPDSLTMLIIIIPKLPARITSPSGTSP